MEFNYSEIVIAALSTRRILLNGFEPFKNALPSVFLHPSIANVALVAMIQCAIYYSCNRERLKWLDQIAITTQLFFCIRITVYVAMRLESMFFQCPTDT